MRLALAVCCMFAASAAYAGIVREEVTYSGDGLILKGYLA